MRRNRPFLVRSRSAKRGDYLRREEGLCPAWRQPGWKRPRIEVGDRHCVRQVADHAYHAVRVDHLQQSALLQRFLIIQVRGERLKATSLKPYRAIVDVIGCLGKSFLGILDMLAGVVIIGIRKMPPCFWASVGSVTHSPASNPSAAAKLRRSAFIGLQPLRGAGYPLARRRAYLRHLRLTCRARYPRSASRCSRC
jgi:hypothetical protein